MNEDRREIFPGHFKEDFYLRKEIIFCNFRDLFGVRQEPVDGEVLDPLVFEVAVDLVGRAVDDVFYLMRVQKVEILRVK